MLAVRTNHPFFFTVGMALLFGLLWGANPHPLQAAELVEQLVINEIHPNPDRKNEAVEFVELYNPTSHEISLAHWALNGGVDYLFPLDAKIGPGGYVVVAQNPAALYSKFGIVAFGPFSGQLNNEGNDLILRNSEAKVIDSVTYGLGFPWPVVGDPPGFALELINPTQDNAQPGYWRAGGPSPGQLNSTWTDNPPPALALVSHTPQSPTDQESVRITVQVSDTDGIANVLLYYQLVTPGNYFTLYDLAYASERTALAMADQGDGRYMVEMPAELRRHRHLVRYWIVATDQTGRSVTAPYPDDPQPNFAYFVYNGMPAWSGAIRPGVVGEQGYAVTYDFNAIRALPVYHFLAKADDVEDAQFIPNSTRPAGYMGDDYPWLGTLVYNGQVYDHIGFRARGGIHRYSVGKNMWKFNFLRGHRFQAYDNHGRPYPVKWDKLNFSAAIQHANRGHRGEQGLFESLAFRLFNLAGVEASNTHFVHFRVIDQVAEYENQYQGDFWGLYLAIQEVDGPFLDSYHLPDGNLYKMENGTGELNNQGLTGASDKADLNDFLWRYTYTTPDVTWWRQNLDLDRYFRYRAILEALHHYDVNQGKNYLYYLNPNTGRWSVHPWDLDLTWAETMPGDGNEPFRDRVLLHPELNVQFQNHLRELRDLLWNPDQLFPLIDEYAALINSPSDGLAMVDADRARWDYSPILRSRYVEPSRGGHGKFYERTPSRTFPGMAQLMKEWVVTRGAWLDQKLLTDPYLPATPSVAYQGPANFPADQLTFASSPFADGAGGFAAMQWRVAVLRWPGLPGYQPNTPNQYEIEAAWQSPALPYFTPQITLTPGACLPGQLCRVRVRMKNTIGRWSHWSAPLQFVAGAPTQPPLNTLKLTELMYHPPNLGFIPDSELEFVELKNTGSSPIDLTNLRFDQGISYTFPLGANLGPGELLVLAKNNQWFRQKYGFAAAGEYSQRLNNNGDQVVLRDAFGRTLFTVHYQDRAPWPLTVDGLGFSLVLNNPSQPLDPNNGAHWRASLFSGGSPGEDDPGPVVINELLVNPLTNQQSAVELYNPAPYEAPIGGWYLTDEPNKAQKYRLPTGATIPPDGYLLLPLADVIDDSRQELFQQAHDGIYLVAANRQNRLLGYQHGFQYGAAPPGFSFGRYVTGVGQERFPIQSITTLGAANAPPAVGPVVISAITYVDRPGHPERIELTNLSQQATPLYDPANPEHTWRIVGAPYQFPTGVEIPPQGKLVLTSADPAQQCATVGSQGGIRILGPLPFRLADGGESLALEQPSSDRSRPAEYVTVDEVAYSAQAPWPSSGAIQRLQLMGYGSDPLNWRAQSDEETPLQSAALGPMVEICHFAALSQLDGTVKLAWTTYRELHLTGFNLLRSADGVRTHAELIAPTVTAQGDGQSGASYHLTDGAVKPGVRYLYWLTGVGAADEPFDLLFTALHTPTRYLYFPLIQR
jgi:hypothetical protein